MNKPEPAIDDKSRSAPHVFVSFSSANQRKALSLCGALEDRGIPCWISCRDVLPAENYQESIVRALQTARAMVLVFSRAANSSDEIKKELSLASQFRIPVIALRIEKVQPTDAFAYELSTRQWIDAFPKSDQAMDAVAAALAQAGARSSRKPVSGSRRPARAMALAVVFLVLFIGFGSWLWLRQPARSPAQALQVRLASFQRLSDDLPATLPDTMREEMIGAFGKDSIVRLSTASGPPPGNDPAYALTGTVRREGTNVRALVRVADERTGATLWTNDFAMDAGQLDRIPRRVAIATSTIVRCGLFGASTYRKPLPEATLSDYFQACQNVADEPEKGLDFARKVVAAVPDFSWGWSMVEMAAFNALLERPPADKASQYRGEALRAADKAIELDPTNSEAFAYKSHLVPQADLVGRERLLQQAVHARALPCGCEHHFYGDFLSEVGRLDEAVAEYKRGIDIQAFNANAQLSLAQVYYALNRPDLARESLDAGFAMIDDPEAIAQLRATLAPIAGQYKEGLRLVNDPEHGAPPPVRPALSAAFSALVSQDPAARAKAVGALHALPPPAHGGMYVNLLAALGAERDALDGVVAAVQDGKRAGVRSWLFVPPASRALRDPAFPAVAQKLGLIGYWRATRSRPDVCRAGKALAFCAMIGT